MLEKIDDFEIIRPIGKGGMGDVFLVKDPVFDRPLALKKIRKDLAQHKMIQERFLKEAYIAAKLTHPSIMPIYSISKNEENIYYTMPYIEGETLKQILLHALKTEKNGEENPHPVGSSVPALVRIFMNVCQAIAYAHSRGVIHRDLKPDNVMVGKYGEVMIFDWGIAEEMSDKVLNDEKILSSSSLTRPGKIPGTLSHLAPERALGERASFLTDIYALGVMLYQILALRLPFRRESLEEFQKHAANEEFFDPQELAPYRDIPPQLVSMTKRCLAKKEERIASVHALIEELQNYIDGRPEWVLGDELLIQEKKD